MGNKLQAAASAVTPQNVLAEQHRKMAEPVSGKRLADEATPDRVA